MTTKPLMKAAIFVEAGRIVLDDKPVPEVGPTDALMKVTTTTICGTAITRQASTLNVDVKAHNTTSTVAAPKR